MIPNDGIQISSSKPMYRTHFCYSKDETQRGHQRAQHATQAHFYTVTKLKKARPDVISNTPHS